MSGITSWTRSTLGAGLVLGTLSVQAEEIRLGEDVTVIKRTIKPGKLEIVLRNVIPGKRYVVESEIIRRTINVDPLDVDEEELRFMTTMPVCDAAQAAFNNKIKSGSATAPKTEKDVADAVNGYKTELDSNKCPQEYFEQAISATSSKSLSVGDVEENETLKLSIKRLGESQKVEEDLGTYTFETERTPPGEWLTFYGANFIRANDQRHFTKAGTDQPVTYTVTAVADREDRQFAPSVYFMWIKKENYPNVWLRPISWNYRDLFGGISGGIGFEGDKPIAFVGYGFGWGYNIMLTAGVAMHREKRLNGQYSPGETIASNLTEDQLTEETYGSSPYVGIAFRFGANPFQKDTPKMESIENN